MSKSKAEAVDHAGSVLQASGGVRSDNVERQAILARLNVSPEALRALPADGVGADRPPRAELLGEDAERALHRGLDVDRAHDRRQRRRAHVLLLRSSCSALALKAASAPSQKLSR